MRTGWVMFAERVGYDSLFPLSLSLPISFSFSLSIYRVWGITNSPPLKEFRPQNSLAVMPERIWTSRFTYDMKILIKTSIKTYHAFVVLLWYLNNTPFLVTKSQVLIVWHRPNTNHPYNSLPKKCRMWPPSAHFLLGWGWWEQAFGSRISANYNW